MNGADANKKLLEIYRRRVLDHSRHPHNLRRPARADREVTGFNPLCGDKLTVYISLDGETISDVAFEGTGCAISMAAASMMTEALTGQPVARADKLINQVNAMFAEGVTPDDSLLEDTRALENVREYPSRIKCATLPWTAAEAALHDDTRQVSTE